MAIQWALACYTLLTQLAAGLAVFLFWKGVRAVRAGECAPYGGWLAVVAGAAAGLVVSLFGPWRPGEQLPGVEGLAFALVAAVSFLTWQLRGRATLNGLAAVAGLVGVVVQGVRYAPAPLSTPAGMLPLALFLLNAAAMGAVLAQQGVPEGKKGFVGPLRLALGLQLLVLALAACVGPDAAPALKRLSLAWMEFLPYWAGVMATGVALGVSFMGRSTALVQAALVLVSALCVRMALFLSAAPLS